MSSANSATPKNSTRHVYTPGYILDDTRLDFFDKFLLSHLLNLTQSGKPAYAGNQYLADYFHVKVRHVRDRLSKLEELNLIKRYWFGKQRYISVISNIIAEASPPDENENSPTESSSSPEGHHSAGGEAPQCRSDRYHSAANNKDNNKKDKIKDLALPPEKKAVRATDKETCSFFSMFYESYPRKADRADAAKEFHELTKDMGDKEKKEFVEKLKVDCGARQLLDWRDGKEFIPYAKKYLKNKQWQNELTQRSQPKSAKPAKPENDHYKTDWRKPIQFPSERAVLNTPALEQGNVYDA